MKIINVNDSSFAKEVIKELAKYPLAVNEKGISLRLSFSELNLQEIAQDVIKNENDATKSMIWDKLLFISDKREMTYNLFKEYKKKNADKKNTGILIFDAHSGMKKSNNIEDISHDNWLLKMISEELIKPENIIIAGLRQMNAVEFGLAKEMNIKYFSSKEFSFEGLAESCDAIMAASREFDELYISIDLDVLDPAFAEGLIFPEPAGLTTRELIYLLQRVSILKNIKAIDIAGLAQENICKSAAQLGRKIASELNLS